MNTDHETERCSACGRGRSGRKPIPVDVDRIITSYRAGYSIRSIAGLVDATYGTVRKRLVDHHVPLRPRGGDQRKASA